MKKFKTISMGLVLTMGLMTGLGATQVFADDEKVYKIACDQAYAPFSIQQDDGSYKGIDVELLAAIAEEEGFEYELISQVSSRHWFQEQLMVLLQE